MARAGNPDAVLIAESGGLNAMLVDSTALAEQAIRDVLVSAFQSAGQRCSALRLLYLQEDIESRFLDMLFGAIDELSLGDPWALATDIGPVIDRESQQNIEAYCQEMESQGRLLKKLDRTRPGFSVPPAVYRIKGIEALEREVFGPILHVASFATDGIERVIDAVNGRGYGLTFGLHTRIDKRVQRVIARLRVGNLYVNRNQIGAVVGSQPFDGEGLSGTGPKAGGPFYVSRLRQTRLATLAMKRGEMEQTNDLTTSTVQCAIDQVVGLPVLSIRERFDRLRSALAGRWSDLEEVLLPVKALPLVHWELPGPTGESNRYAVHPGGVVLCFGTSESEGLTQACQALAIGNTVVVVLSYLGPLMKGLLDNNLPIVMVEGYLEPARLSELSEFHAVALEGQGESLRPYRTALAARQGPLLPLITGVVGPEAYVVERHVCVDTTAAGGNASLLLAS